MDLNSEDFHHLRSVDFETQAFLDAAKAAHEQGDYDGSGSGSHALHPSKNRRRRIIAVEDESDGGDNEKSCQRGQRNSSEPVRKSVSADKDDDLNKKKKRHGEAEDHDDGKRKSSHLNKRKKPQDDDGKGNSSHLNKRKKPQAEGREADHDGKGTSSQTKKKKNKTDDDDKGKSSDQKPRRQYSFVWKHFVVVTKPNGEEKSQCKHCKVEYAHDSHRNGTNNMRRHLKKCNLKATSGDVRQMMIDTEARLQARKIDHSVFSLLVAKCIIQHDLPFAYVEYERVRSVWKYLNADVRFISRNTAAADDYRFYQSETDNLKKELANLPGRISFTSDLWSAITHEGYMYLTAHYIDTNWKLNNKIIAFCALPPPHTGMHLAIQLLDSWKEWGIDKKSFFNHIGQCY